MRIIAVLAGAVLLVVLVAVLAVPALVDWNAYKPEITARLERDLGRRVEIAGELSLSLLPRPEITAEGIRLAEGGGGPVELVSVDRLRLQVKAVPLLRGRVVVEELVLVAPVAVVHTEAADAAPAPAPPQRAEAPPAAPEAAPGAEFVVRRLVVQDGRVRLRKGEEVLADLADLDGEVEAGDSGLTRAKGSFAWNGRTMTVDAALGSLSARPTPVSIALRVPELGAEARLSGQVTAAGGEPGLHGKLAITAQDARGAFALAGVDAGPALAGELAVEGEVQGRGRTVSVEKAAFRLGDMRAAGSLTLSLAEQPRLETTLAFSSLDLDKLVAAAAPGAEAKTRGRAQKQPEAADAFTLPTGVTVAAEIAAEAMVYRGAILRDARIAATLAEGVLKVRHAGALLPGGAEVTLSGRLAAQQGQPQAEAAFEASADNLRATLRWLGLQPAGVPADRLRPFAANGKLVAEGGEIRLRDLDLAVDGSRLSGAVTVRPGPRPSFGANLVADDLDLDAYLPRPAAPAAATGEDGAAPPKNAAEPDWLGVLDSFDANLRARVGQLTVNDVTLNDVTVDGTLFNGDLTLRKASIGEIGGTSGRASGVVAGLGRGDLSVRDVAFELRSRQPEKALRLLGIDPPPLAERLGSLALTGTVDGGADALKVKLRAETAGGVASLDGTVTTPLATPRYRFAAEASHAGFAEVVRLWAPDYRPRGRLGAFALSAGVEGDATAVSLSDLRAKLGPLNLAGTAGLQLAAKPVLTATLTAGALPVDDFLPAERNARAESGGLQPVSTAPARQDPWSREPLDLAWMRDLDAAVAVTGQAVSYGQFLLDKPDLQVKLRDGVFAVERLDGTLFDGPLAFRASLAADGAAAARLTIEEARLRQAPLEAGGIEIASGILATELDLQTQGRSSAEMVSRLSGSARLQARDGTIRGVNIGEVSRRLNDIDDVRDVLGLVNAGRSGATPFARLAGTFKIVNGIASTDDLALDAEGGTAHALATVNLPRYTVDGRVVFRLTDHPKAPSFVMLVRGPLDEPRREFETAELQSWLLGRGAKRLMERSERAGKVGEALQKIVPGAQDSQRPEQKLLEGLIDQLGR